MVTRLAGFFVNAASVRSNQYLFCEFSTGSTCHKNSGEGLLSDMSSIPPELCTPTPRRVRWRALPLLLVAFWLALVLGFPSAIIQSSWREFHIDDILAARGEIAKGHVLGKIELPPTAKNPGVRYKHRIDYEFVPPGALEPVRGSDWVNPAEYHRLDSDGPVDVVFDPADPSKSEVEYTERTAFRSSRLQFERARIVAPLFAALGCAMAFAIAYAPFRQRQLLRWEFQRGRGSSRPKSGEWAGGAGAPC